MTETVEIERMAYGPEGIAHLESGKIVFVSSAVTGDIAEIDITQEKPNFAKAKTVRIVEPSPLRAENEPCGMCCVCGGCPWAALSYRSQLEAKRSHIVEALVRTGGVERKAAESLVEPCVPSKREWRYRNKIELGAFTDASGKFALGMHAAGSDKPIPIERCPLANRLIEKAPKAITGALRFLNGREDLDIFRVELRASLRTKSVEIALWTPPGGFPRAKVAKTLQSALKATSIVRVLADPGKMRKVKKVEVLQGDGFWRETLNVCLADTTRSVADVSASLPASDQPAAHTALATSVASATSAAPVTPIAPTAPAASAASATSATSIAPALPVTYTVSAPSFFQVNTSQAEKMVQLALNSLAPLEGAEAADLYSGVGTFSIPMALSGAYVTAIELAGSSSRDARRNIEIAGADVDAVCDDVSRAFADMGLIDALLVDPPRAGLAQEAVSHIADAHPGKLVYVSCDPQTLARDVRRLQERGFALKSVTPLDLFPQTYHVEAMAMFC